MSVELCLRGDQIEVLKILNEYKHIDRNICSLLRKREGLEDREDKNDTGIMEFGAYPAIASRGPFIRTIVVTCLTTTTHGVAVAGRPAGGGGSIHLDHCIR